MPANVIPLLSPASPRTPGRGDIVAISEARAKLVAAGVAAQSVFEPSRLISFVAQLGSDERVDLELVPTERHCRLEVAAISPRSQERADAILRRLGMLAAQRTSFRAASAPRRPHAHTIPVLPVPLPALDAATPSDLLLSGACTAVADLRLALRACENIGVARLRISLSALRLSESEQERIELARFRLGAKPDIAMNRRDVVALLSLWRQASRGVAIAVNVESEAPLGSLDLDTLSLLIFGAARGTSAKEELDLRLAYPAGTGPAWRFCPAPIDLQRPQQDEHVVPAAGSGALTLGRDAADDPVRISAKDRMRHTYVVGGTGVGKSTLLHNLIAEDIANGEGVMLVDPHGDLAEAVAATTPACRRNDIIWMDVGDAECAYGVNLFATAGIDPEVERNRVANQLVSFFRQMYADVPEAMGPAFELYFRNAIFLLMLAEKAEHRSLCRFEDVFADTVFRTTLVRLCSDPKVRQFWSDISDRTTGDSRLENIAPYIINKMNQLTGSPLARRMLGGVKPDLDLARAMDEGKIVLVRLAKGVIGDYDSRFLGALLLMSLTEAAMRRTARPAEQRRPFRVYVDEFQNLATKSAADLLAECRKYGLSLVLANQSLSQLRSHRADADVAEAALANCGTIIAFRVGLADAVSLAASCDLTADPRAFTGLAVGEMIVRALCDGRPTAPQQVMSPSPLAAPAEG